MKTLVPFLQIEYIHASIAKTELLIFSDYCEDKYYIVNNNFIMTSLT